MKQKRTPEQVQQALQEYRERETMTGRRSEKAGAFRRGCWTIVSAGEAKPATKLPKWKRSSHSCAIGRFTLVLGNERRIGASNATKEIWRG
ncbi:MAG TPA: hypothetical protein VEX68_25130 [Bryobacteraceae bacterium]|nr:hypothetical protein [Bryobacteraceae bacterium]